VRVAAHHAAGGLRSESGADGRERRRVRGYHDDHFGTKNACNTPISIWFMQRDGSVMHADVAAGEPFDSGLTANDMAGKDWDHAVCPAGFEPEPALSAATFDKVHNDEYSCARAAS
jgi:hypothetical protein